MKTTLNTKAYWAPAFYFLAPILFLISMGRKSNPKEMLFDHSLYILLVFAVCLGCLAFTLFSYYKEYSFNNEKLMIKDLISKEIISINLCDIKNLKLIEKSVRSGSYHNILVETKNRRHTLKGMYINEMIYFFYELEKAVKQ